MSALRVHLFGKFSVQCNEQALNGLDGCKVQELFCYLLLHRDHPYPREALAGLLWADCLTPQSKKYLRKALWQLQAALNSRLKPNNDRILLVDTDWVQLNSHAELWIDVVAFERVFALVQGVPGQEVDIQSARALKDAVQLYHGDLLEGWYQEWCLYERERLRNTFLAMLDKLMGYCEVHQEYETGVLYGMQILRYDRARERTHRQLMRLYYLAGDRTGALHQYEYCVTALYEELGVKPAKRTIALYEEIRADEFNSSFLITTEAGTVQGGLIVPGPAVLGQLKQLWMVLTDIQHRVQQGIETIEKTLDGHN